MILSTTMMYYESTTQGSFDATPGNGGFVKLPYENKTNTTNLIAEVYTQNGILVHRENLGSQQNGTTKNYQWYGDITFSTKYYASQYTSYVGPPQYVSTEYYAKDGTYKVYIFPTEKKKKSKHARGYVARVANDMLSEINWIPVPPKNDYTGTKVTAKNKDKCEYCRNYFYRYILEPNTNSIEADYVAWSREIYGNNGLEQFWQTSELIVYNPNLSALDNIQNTIGLIGMIPVLGEPVDGINGVVYLIRGQHLNAALSGASMIPIVGNGVAGLKPFRSFYKAVPCTCFPAGTVIETADGEVPIEEIEVGELILSKNTDTGEVAYKEVEGLYQREVEELVVISVGGEQIPVTAEHPFWVVDKGWIEAAKLQEGDQLESNDGSLLTIESVEKRVEQSYNFSVSDFHTYYATELKILTNNESCNFILTKY